MVRLLVYESILISYQVIGEGANNLINQSAVSY